MLIHITEVSDRIVLRCSHFFLALVRLDLIGLIPAKILSAPAYRVDVFGAR
jgi:hypothetical protein